MGRLEAPDAANLSRLGGQGALLYVPLPPFMACTVETRRNKVFKVNLKASFYYSTNQSNSTQRGDSELLCSMEQSTPSGIDLGLVRQSTKYSVESDGLSASLASKHVSCFYDVFLRGSGEVPEMRRAFRRGLTFDGKRAREGAAVCGRVVSVRDVFNRDIILADAEQWLSLNADLPSVEYPSWSCTPCLHYPRKPMLE